MDPYEILGVTRTTPFGEIRTRYFQLARKHHPDKCGHLPLEEQKANEAYFQRITAAYQQIEQGESNGTTDETVDREDWRSVWKRVETFFQRPDVWDCMKTVLQDTIVDVVQKAAQLQHRIKIPVTLEEIHRGKQKRVQLFLKGFEEPFITTVSCAEFPELRLEHVDERGLTHWIDCIFEVRPHARFRLDTLLGGMDLYMTERMNWLDYVMGKRIEIENLDGNTDVYMIPAFPRMNLPIVYEGRGVHGKGDLYVHLEWHHCTMEEWGRLDATEQKIFIEIVSKLFRITEL